MNGARRPARRRAAAEALAPAGPSLRQRGGVSLPVRWSLFALILVGYAVVGLLVAFLASRSGNYLDGTDAMYYVHRGDFLYKSITREGNWFPLIDMAWYNGVETWRYWSPLPAYILAGCQGLMGGSANGGFLLFSALLYFLDGAVWLHIGRTHDRPWLGAFLGALWFFVPNTSVQMLFSEGVLARAMTMPVLPLLFVYVHDYFTCPQKRFSSLPKLIVCFLLLLWCHIGWGGMVAITLLIYLLFRFFSQMKQPRTQRVMISPMVVCVLLAFLIDGIALLPSLKGGITGLDSSDVMATYFQSLRMSVDPFRYVGQGVWNRWMYAEAPYYGLTALAVTLLGLLCARREVKPGFATALTILLLSTPTAYQILVYLPGNQYLWMTRFLSIALCVFLVAVFFWRSLKKWILGLFAVLFALEVLCTLVLVTHSTNPLSPDAYRDHLSEAMLIDQGKAVATQRMSVVDPYDSEIDSIYVSSSYGQRAVPTSFGQGVQAAVNYPNLVNLNQAAENESYLYLFDRFLELGNDTVIVPVELQHSSSGRVTRDVEALTQAARRVGYSQVAANDSYLLFHLDQAPQGHFGVVSKYRAAAIGTGVGDIAVGFPAVEELDDVVLDHYAFDELKDYDVLYLAGFSYDDKETAEDLVLRLSQSGTRVLIMADGIPDEERTGSKTFLGVSCNRVNFQNGYPALDTIDGVLYCSLFPSGYSKDWQTVYVNGLDQVWGTITDVPEGKMDFYGTVKNDNIVFIGLALTYHYALTQDPAVGQLLSHALTLSPDELPQRQVVPIDLTYQDNVITIDAPCDNVNTTLSFHDIFRADREIRSLHHLTAVDRGRTQIRLVYPYLVPSLSVTLVGLLLTAAYLVLIRRRLRGIAQAQAGSASEAPTPETAAPAPGSAPESPAEPTESAEPVPEAPVPEAPAPEAPTPEPPAEPAGPAEPGPEG